MATLTAIREAIRDTLQNNIAGLSVHERPTGTLAVPCVAVMPAGADYEQAFGRGLDTWEFNLDVLMIQADQELSQQELDAYVDGGGSKSIRKVIFNNRTLGLTDVTAHISGMSGYNGRYTYSGNEYTGARLRLVVAHTPDA